mmetsp:Transcript_15813/g.20644  ORF Transcript_15813/g.20644 Transcript_15813/m.20644 type:complete len:556 (-) Transcript_15813:36-1703(-)|eukprot:CAMPEP_0198148314 /NCGR_PEP_ID=MMETSP1443-20131203/40871_1 /TAXON_ID=186043 /ORGANISM="Entomoneis sp., Strain CCMP2396" /LENGTH=555 /DNA_ID=CAMNT_0043812969 /DNA_START=26 /DNA_END=1693 /DNA_ORIENTATION=+
MKQFSSTLCLLATLSSGGFSSITHTAAAFAAPSASSFQSRATHYHGRIDDLAPPTASRIHQRRIPSGHNQRMADQVLKLRGGSSLKSAAGIVAKFGTNDPQSLFNTSLLGLALITFMIKVLQKTQSGNGSADAEKKPASIKSLQARFLSVFWILRCSDWLQGPYFYDVYTSKMFNGAPASMALVSRLFLTGFASRAIFGPSVGSASDQYGRKKATLAFCVIYAIGALSTNSPLLWVLLMGRVLSGVGTGLLFSAPESWLVGEAQKSGDDPDGKYLGETFGLAYAGDAIVAIIAGQLAGLAASASGPTGPFQLSSGFLGVGFLLTALLWKENRSTTADSDDRPSISDAIRVIREDHKILLVGAVQSLFEAAMYIFVLQWPPVISAAVKTVFGQGASIPYGTVFSCFMASCLLGSTIFGQLAKMKVKTENSAAGMLSVAAVAMGVATWTVGSSGGANLATVVAAFFAFEACVGMYFPSLGSLRSKYIPDSHRSVIMNLFGVPLNVLVVSVFLSINKLGIVGALAVSTGALGVAALCMLQLLKTTQEGKKDGSIEYNI